MSKKKKDMAITLADQYYLKALEEYGYDLEASMENLNYALSYNDEHAGANYLMGKVYMEQFDKFELAEDYFICAMASDPDHIKTCEAYTWLMIKTRRYNEALRLIKYTTGLIGVSMPEVIRMEALVKELMKDFFSSIGLLKLAIEESYDSGYIEFLERELERVEKKQRNRDHIQYHFAE